MSRLLSLSAHLSARNVRRRLDLNKELSWHDTNGYNFIYARTTELTRRILRNTYITNLPRVATTIRALTGFSARRLDVSYSEQ